MKDFFSLLNNNNNFAIIQQGKSFSGRELFCAAEESTRTLTRKSLVFLVATHTVDCISCYIGLLGRGMTCMIIDQHIRFDNLVQLICAYEPEYLLCPANWKHQFNKKQTSVNNTYIIIELSPGNKQPPNNGLALLLMTSGSTGSPKTVKISYENLMDNTINIIQSIDVRKGDRSITTLPMHYTYGLSIINTHLCAGASIVLNDRPVINSDFWELCEQYQVTTWGGVPFTYEMLLKIKFQNKIPNSLRYMTQAGGRLLDKRILSLADICEQKGIQFIVMYGQTEATARMSYLPFESVRKKIGSIGIAITGGKFELRSEEGAVILQPNKTGELVYFGKNVFWGYAESRSDLFDGDTVGGVLYTGDIAFYDKDGFFYLTGRKNRYTKMYGKRYSLDDIEKYLNEKGIQCLCTGYEENYIDIYLKRKIDYEEIKKIIQSNFFIPSSSIRIQYISDFPVNAHGKIDYWRLAPINASPS